MTQTIENKFITGKQLDELGAELKVERGDIFIYHIKRDENIEEYILQRCTGNKTERYKILDVLYYPISPIKIKAEGCRE